MSLGKPLITSDWPYLQELFPKGTIYVPNSGKGIRGGILAMQKMHNSLEKEMLTFRQEIRSSWDNQFAQLKEIIANHFGPSSPKDIRASKRVLK